MTAEIAGLPFWELTFDAEGDPDGAQRDRSSPRSRRGVTDVIVFAHGWNNDQADRERALHAVLQRCSRQLTPQASGRQGRAGGRVLAVAALVRRADPGLRRRRRRGRRRAVRPRCGAGATGGGDRRPADSTRRPPRWRPDDAVPGRRRQRWTGWRELLAGPADAAALTEFTRQLDEFSAGHRREPGRRRGRRGRLTPARRTADAPRRPDRRCSSGTATRCVASGVTLDDGGRRRGRPRRRAGRPAARRQGGAAPGDVLADEEPGRHRRPQRARPLLGRLRRRACACHLVGHSFGARLVSFALAGLPAGPSPVRP